jgi:hypothetical protein
MFNVHFFQYLTQSPSAKVKNPDPKDLALVCPLEGGFHDAALFNILMEYSITP